MKTLLRLSKLVLPLIPVMILAVLFGTVGHFWAIGIPTISVCALLGAVPLWIHLIIGVARGVLHYIEQYCNHYLAFSILARIRAIVFKKLRELVPARLETKEQSL